MTKVVYEMEGDAVTLETPDIKTIRLRWPQNYAPEVKTGQFITLFWPDRPQQKRAYSLSSCALDRGYYEITVKREGAMSHRIVEDARPGDRFGIYPPAGRFLPVYGPNTQLFCLAGGIGVAPYRGFVREATRRKLPNRITLLYSVRRQQDAIFHKEFSAMREQNRNFQFHITCTRISLDDPWCGRRGRIDVAWIREHTDLEQETIYYACGSNAFVACTEAMLQKEMGIPKERIKTEKWG